MLPCPLQNPVYRLILLICRSGSTQVVQPTLSQIWLNLTPPGAVHLQRVFWRLWEGLERHSGFFGGKKPEVTFKTLKEEMRKRTWVSELSHFLLTFARLDFRATDSSLGPGASVWHIQTAHAPMNRWREAADRVCLTVSRAAHCSWVSLLRCLQLQKTLQGQQNPP